MDARATAAACAIALAVVVVRRRVAAAMTARERREAAERAARETRLARLAGRASADDDDAALKAVDAALEAEATAREMFGIFRVRLPRSLGTTLRDARAEEARLDAIRGAASPTEDIDDDDDASRAPPWWMTTTSAVVLVLLCWCGVGTLAVDRVAEAPAPLPPELARAYRDTP